MAKKIVRGITDVKTINSQDFDTNNVNDLLSDGQYNYIHRKKGKNEEYHNLTDNIKTISSDNTELLSVTNNNKTTNTATLHPKHDAQKEQVLESTRDTITINHGENGTAEKTTVDTNPKKVLEHENLLTDYGLSKTTSGNTTKLGVAYTRVSNGFDLNNLTNGRVRGEQFVNAPNETDWFFVSSFSEGNYTIQEAITMADDKNTTYRRLKKTTNVWGAWREQVTEKSVIYGLLAQKQNKLTSNLSIGINSDNSLSQLYYYKKSYTQAGGILKTYIKQVALNTNISEVKNEYNLLLRINQGQSSLTFTLEGTDSFFFSLILGSSNTANILGCIFTKSDTTLTVSTTNNTDKDYIITFSELLD